MEQCQVCKGVGFEIKHYGKKEKGGGIHMCNRCYQWAKPK